MFSTHVAWRLTRSAPRDARIGATVGLLPRPATTPDGPAVVFRLDAVLPVGDERIFAGQSGIGAAPSFAAEFRAGRLTIGADIGARLRKTSDLSGTRVGSQAVPQPEEIAFRTRNMKPRTQRLARGLGWTLSKVEKLPGLRSSRGRFQFWLLTR